LSDTLQAIPARSAILHAELVFPDANGAPHFYALLPSRRRTNSRTPPRIALRRMSLIGGISSKPCEASACPDANIIVRVLSLKPPDRSVIV
jgi:hypothetical protein